jgi:hypothetical protein
VKNKLKWKREQSCGGTTMYAAVVGNSYLCGVSKECGVWMIWSPAMKKIIGEFDRLRDAKAWVVQELKKHKGK